MDPASAANQGAPGARSVLALIRDSLRAATIFPMRAAAVGLVIALGVALAAHTLAILIAAPAVTISGGSPAAMAVTLVAGLLAVGVGAVAMLRLPDSAFGLLLAGTGCVWFLAEWNSPGAGSALAFTAGLAGGTLWPAAAAHAALAFPAGRVAGRVDRTLVAAAYLGAGVLLGVLPATLSDPARSGCGACPPNLLAVHHDPALAATALSAGVGFGVAWSAALALCCAWRLVRDTAAARRGKAVVLGSAIIALAATSAAFVHAVGRPALLLDDLTRTLWWAQAIALIGIQLGVLAGWWRARRARDRVAGLVLALGTARPGGLRDSLATALGDRELTIRYPLADSRAVDATGQPSHRATGPDRATTALVRDGDTIAVLTHRRDLLGDPRLVEDVVSAARLPLDNERLQAVAQAQLAELAASRARIVEAGDAERRRLERDLHDGAQQRLVALAIGLRLLRTRADATAAERLDEAIEHLRRAITELRDLASGIYPAVLIDSGLAGGLAALKEESPHAVRVAAVPEQRLPPPVEATAYLLVAAAAATGPVRVTATVDGGRLIVEIQAEAEPASTADLTDRVTALGGTLTVGPAGGSTLLRAELPCG